MKPHANIRASALLEALSAEGWSVKRQTASHRTLCHQRWPLYVFPLRDDEVVGPRMQARIARQHPSLAAREILLPTIIKHKRAIDLWSAIFYISLIATIAGTLAIYVAGNFLDKPMGSLVGILWIIWFILIVFAGQRIDTNGPKHGIASRKLAAASKSFKAVEDGPAPVLYLRSFVDDGTASRIYGKDTEEEHLAQVLSEIGPVVAIGRPGESIPELGANRIYVDGEEWRSTVEDLMKTARLVVIRANSSENLVWEFRRAVELVAPDRLLLVVANRRHLKNILLHLPGNQRAKWWRFGGYEIGSMRAFVIFGMDWTPRLLRVRAAVFGDPKKGSEYHMRLALTLRPVFGSLGVKSHWAPPLWNPSAAALWSIGLGFAYGALLHMNNWHALGEFEKARGSRRWVVAGVSLEILWKAATLGFGVVPQEIRVVALALWLCMLVGWYFRSARSQIAHVEAMYGETYPRRGSINWIFGSIITLAFLLLTFSL